jgi:hypothetical protein
VEVHDKLDEITRYVEDARAMPMSASALVNRAELLVLLDELRDLIPEELHHADLLLSDRDAVVAQGRAEAEQLLTQAQAEHDRLVEQTEVVESARQRAAADRAHGLTADADLATVQDDAPPRELESDDSGLPDGAERDELGR